MPEIRRNYSINQKAEARLAKAPNLCGMGDRTSGEARQATIEMFALAVNHGFTDGVLRVSVDVLQFLSQDEQYAQDWGDPRDFAQLLALISDASPEKRKAAIDVLRSRDQH